MIKWLVTLYYTWVYRDVDDDLCCCGNQMAKTPYGSCVASCRSAKEYAITSRVEHYENKNKTGR